MGWRQVWILIVILVILIVLFVFVQPLVSESSGFFENLYKVK